MNDIWGRTVDVTRDRAPTLTPIAGLLAFLPTAVAAATFVAQLGAALVMSVHTIVTGVFTARFGRARTGQEAAGTFA